MADTKIKPQHHPAKSFLKSPLSLYFLAPSCLSGYKSIMQNEPNFLKAKTNATPFAAKVYQSKPPLATRRKRTQSNPNEPNVKIGKMKISSEIVRVYANQQRTMSNERYSKQTQFSRTSREPGVGGNKEEKTIFFQNPVVTTIELPQTSYILVRRLTDDPVAPLWAAPHLFPNGGRHPHTGEPWAKARPAARGCAPK